MFRWSTVMWELPPPAERGIQGGALVQYMASSRGASSLNRVSAWACSRGRHCCLRGQSAGLPRTVPSQLAGWCPLGTRFCPFDYSPPFQPTQGDDCLLASDGSAPVVAGCRVPVRACVGEGSEPAAGPGGCESVWCGRVVPARTGVCGDDQPGPPVGRLGFPQPGAGPSQGLLEQPRGVFQVEPAEKHMPGPVDIRVSVGGTGLRGSPHRGRRLVLQRMLDRQPDQRTPDQGELAFHGPVRRPDGSASGAPGPTPVRRPCRSSPSPYEW